MCTISSPEESVPSPAPELRLPEFLREAWDRHGTHWKVPSAPIAWTLGRGSVILRWQKVQRGCVDLDEDELRDL